jgi:hypothetical protein
MGLSHLGAAALSIQELRFSPTGSGPSGPLRAGMVIAITPPTTKARPIQAAGDNVSPRTDRHADRHPQIGLRRCPDRSERLDKPEIDDEGERCRKHRQGQQRQYRGCRGSKRPWPINNEADRDQ